MPEIRFMAFETWLAYFAACWVISLSPGAGAVSSMASGLNFGFRRGYWNAIGLQLALVIQIAIVAAGVGALLATSALAFTLIKSFGVIYLLYLGWQQWRAPTEALATEQADRQQGRPMRLVLRGFVVNASNPKAIVFILAVLPQFLDASQPLLKQYLLMTITMVGVDLFVMAGYTALAAQVLPLLRLPHQQRWLNRFFGGVFIGAALVLSTVRQVAH